MCVWGGGGGGGGVAGGISVENIYQGSGTGQGNLQN